MRYSGCSDVLRKTEKTAAFSKCEWRDYGISHLETAAVFSVFRRTSEHPLYRIEKRPNLASKQGMYLVVGMDGRILRRGHDLKRVMRFFERKLLRLVS